MDELFFLGHPVEDGQKLIAAIKHTFPQYGRGGPLHLARAERALRGWSRHSPTRVRAPMPVQIMAAMVGYMLTRGWVWAALISTTFFAVLHLQPANIFPIFLLGFLFAYLSHIGKSIWPAIILHAFFNGLNVLLLYYAVQNGLV